MLSYSEIEHLAQQERIAVYGGSSRLAIICLVTVTPRAQSEVKVAVFLSLNQIEIGFHLP